MEPFVAWEDRYVIGIPVIDEQHQELLRLTNELYEACRQGDEVAGKLFKDTVRQTVDYVKEHFSGEEKILERVNYPELGPHKQEHENFVKKVIDEVKNFEGGKTFVPNQFVRFLRDWILAHIAVSDKKYAEYILKLKKEGALKIGV
ncbi:MAG: bacteriohemerythrin [Spirochaetaceae bacterium]|jgi:hemerythrin|nr:bacteriohemerythrin [Spirochaetaceae bacterium]